MRYIFVYFCFACSGFSGWDHSLVQHLQRCTTRSWSGPSPSNQSDHPRLILITQQQHDACLLWLLLQWFQFRTKSRKLQAKFVLFSTSLALALCICIVYVRICNIYYQNHVSFFIQWALFLSFPFLIVFVSFLYLVQWGPSYYVSGRCMAVNEFVYSQLKEKIKPTIYIPALWLTNCTLL